MGDVDTLAVVRLALGATLVLAAAMKAARHARARRALADALGPAGGGAPALAALVVLEGGIGAWLLAGRSPRAAGATAALLLAAFAIGLLRLRAAGRSRVPCACFGGSAERSTSLLALRAAALALAATLVAVEPSAPSTTTLLALALAILAVAVVVLGVLVLALYRQVGVLALRLAPRTALELDGEGPLLGEPAPHLAGLGGGRVLVAFLGASCRLCRALEPSVRALADRDLGVLVVRDDADPAALERWNVPGTPFVVLVIDGIAAAKGLVNTLEELEGLVALGDARVRADREASHALA